MRNRVVQLIPEIEHIEESLELQKKFATSFEYNDFIRPQILDDGKRLEQMIRQYQTINEAAGRSTDEDTLHGVIFDILVHSMDAMVARVADYRIRQSMEIGKALGVKGVIFHSNIRSGFDEPSYLEGWLVSNETYWRRLLAEYPAMEVYLENVFDDTPEMLMRLAVNMQDEKRFGLCFDIGHAALTATPLDIWIDEMLPYTKHLHLNDNHGKRDEHLSLGRGSIDWRLFMKKAQKNLRIDTTALLEVRGIQSQTESLEFCDKRFKTLLL